MAESIQKAKYFANGEWGEHEITFIGHSKGGAEAAANAMASDRNAIIFNPAQVSLFSVGLDAFNFKGSITSYVVKGEPLSLLNKYVVRYGLQYYTIPLPFYSINPKENHSMEAVQSGVRAD